MLVDVAQRIGATSVYYERRFEPAARAMEAQVDGRAHGLELRRTPATTHSFSNPELSRLVRESLSGIYAVLEALSAGRG